MNLVNKLNWQKAKAHNLQTTNHQKRLFKHKQFLVFQMQNQSKATHKKTHKI